MASRNEILTDLKNQKEEKSSYRNRINPATVNLICINDAVIELSDDYEVTVEGLEYLARYTSPGLEVSKEDGNLLYFINEVGDRKLAQRFVEVGRK